MHSEGDMLRDGVGGSPGGLGVALVPQTLPGYIDGSD